MNNNPSDLQKLFLQLETLVYNVDDNIEVYQKKLLLTLLNQEDYEELREMNLSLAEYHVIDCIERNDRLNTTTIAKKLNITKGGISKITAKLIKKDLIQAHRLENNQKEIYYSLKPLGFKAFQLHDVLHRKAREDFGAILNGYNNEELNVISRFSDDLITIFQPTPSNPD